MRSPLVILLLPALVACRTGVSERPRSEPTAAEVRPARLSEGEVGAFTADGDAAYWVAEAALWKRGWDGGAPLRIAAFDREVSTLARHGDALYVVSDTGLHAVPVAGGAVMDLATDAPGPSFAVDDDGVWIGYPEELRLVPAGGGAARVVVAGTSQIDAIATDPDAVYVARITDTEGARAVGDNIAPHAIWRYGKRDGTKARLADLQYGVRAMAVRGDRLIWSTEARGGVESVSVRGGEPTLALPASAEAFDADARGAVVRTVSGVLVEVPVGRKPRLLALPDGWRASPFQPIALAGDGVVVMLEDPRTETRALFRLPRPAADAPTVVAWARRGVVELASDGRDAYFLDDGREPDPAWPARVVRVRRGASNAKVAAAPAITTFAARAGAVAYHDGASVILVEAGGKPRALAPTADVIGLTLGETAAYWIEDGAVRSVPRTGGVAATFHQPDWGSGGSGQPFAELVLDGTSLFYSSLGHGASSVFHARGGAEARVLFESADQGMGDSLAAIGGDLFVVVGPNTIWRVPMNGAAASQVFAAPEGTTLGRLVAGGGRLVVVAAVGDDQVVLAIDPSVAAPAAETLGRIPSSEQTSLAAATADAAYVAFSDRDWIVRFPWLAAPPAAR